jgi:hypothetical protein
MNLRFACTAVSFALLAPAVGHANDWGCTVLLCLSDPRGATTESECRPPLERLWKHLARGRAFPSCVIAGSADTGSGSFARRTFDAFDPCPEGTTAARGLVADASYPRQAWESGRASNARNVNDAPPGPRACVGNLVGSYRANATDDTGIGAKVNVYDRVIRQEPQSPRAIDVYIDGKLHQRVRY